MIGSSETATRSAPRPWVCDGCGAPLLVEKDVQPSALIRCDYCRTTHSTPSPPSVDPHPQLVSRLDALSEQLSRHQQLLQIEAAKRQFENGVFHEQARAILPLPTLAQISDMALSSLVLATVVFVFAIVLFEGVIDWANSQPADIVFAFRFAAVVVSITGAWVWAHGAVKRENLARLATYQHLVDEKARALFEASRSSRESNQSAM